MKAACKTHILDDFFLHLRRIGYGRYYHIKTDKILKSLLANNEGSDKIQEEVYSKKKIILSLSRGTVYLIAVIASNRGPLCKINI